MAIKWVKQTIYNYVIDLLSINSILDMYASKQLTVLQLSNCTHENSNRKHKYITIDLPD